MHQLDLGLFRWMLEYTLDMLKGTKEQTVVNQRLCKIPRFNGLKTFENGLPTHTITAAEYRQLMLLMPFEGLGCSGNITNCNIKDTSTTSRRTRWCWGMRRWWRRWIRRRRYEEEEEEENDDDDDDDNEKEEDVDIETGQLLSATLVFPSLPVAFEHSGCLFIFASLLKNYPNALSGLSKALRIEPNNAFVLSRRQRISYMRRLMRQWIFWTKQCLTLNRRERNLSYSYKYNSSLDESSKQ